MSDERKKINLTVELPLITEAGKKLALEVAGAPFIFEIDGQQETFLAKEITHELLEREANRLATLEDPQRRATEMFQCMAACIHLVGNAQALASEFLSIADGLQTASAQLEVMRRMVIQGMKVQGADSEDA